MADLLTLRKFEVLGPFEIKNELISLAKETSRTTLCAAQDGSAVKPRIAPLSSLGARCCRSCRRA